MNGSIWLACSIVLGLIQPTYGEKVDRLGTATLLNLYISEGHPLPRTNWMASELRQRAADLPPLIWVELEKRETAGELVMVARIAAALMEPNEAEIILNIVKERIRPDADRPIRGSRNPLLMDSIAQCAVQIEHRKANSDPHNPRGRGGLPHERPSDETSTSPSATQPAVPVGIPQKASESKPSPTPDHEPATKTSWSIIVVLIVATCGLLWFLLKRRS
jgi:hypothetical protein